MTTNHLPQRKLSAGVVIVRRPDEAWRVLCLRAFRHWDFPKGLVEDREDPLAAAIREAEEETGLTSLEFRWGRGFRDTEPYAGGKIARYYVAHSRAGDAHLPVNPKLGRPEHHEFRWLEFGDARGLFMPRLQRILDWSGAVIHAHGDHLSQSSSSSSS